MKNDEKFVSVKSLKEYFNYEVVCGDEQALMRPITVADTNRPGLELTGYFDHTQTKRIVILGDKEIGYISKMSEEAQKASFDFLTNPITPTIIISRVHECPPILKQIADEKNFPILRSQNETYRLIIDTITYLDEKLAPSTSLHGVLLSVYGKGVLLTGDSGMGKSEIALELIKRGHLLVADDRVDCYKVHHNVVGTAPVILKEMLEIRGIGIINVAKMFGVSSVLDKVQIELNIHLDPWHPDKDYDRVGIETKKCTQILDVNIPKIELPVKEGRSMGSIIESAVTNYLLSKMGQDSAKEFERRVIEFIEKNKTR